MDKYELNEKCRKIIHKSRHESMCPSKQNKFIDYFTEIALTYPIFNPSHFCIYHYLLKWSSGNIVKTTNDMIAGFSFCRLSTVKNVLKDLILFGFIKRTKTGNGITGRYSNYMILDEDEGNKIRDKNSSKIRNLILSKEPNFTIYIAKN